MLIKINGLPVKCPECGSFNVWAIALVHAYALVNINTAEVDGLEEGEAVVESTRTCMDCHHKWEME